MNKRRLSDHNIMCKERSLRGTACLYVSSHIGCCGYPVIERRAPTGTAPTDVLAMENQLETMAVLADEMAASYRRVDPDDEPCEQSAQFYDDQATTLRAAGVRIRFASTGPVDVVAPFEVAVEEIATLTRYLDSGRYCDCKHDHRMRTCSHCRTWNAWKVLLALFREPDGPYWFRESLVRQMSQEQGFPDQVPLYIGARPVPTEK